MLKKSTTVEISKDLDELLEEAVKVCIQYDRASASLLQRRLSIGYARAARIIDQLQEMGVLSPSDGSSKPRTVLITSFNEFKEKYGEIKVNEPSKEYLDHEVKYLPKIAEFLANEVKKLSKVVDIPYINTNFNEIGNLIIVGNVISKKFEFIKTYLLFILSKFDLSDIRIIISNSTGKLNKFAKMPHLLTPLINDSDKSLSSLRWLSREIDRRTVIINKDENAKFPTIVYIVNYMNLFGVETEDAIKRILSIGAYTGIHLILFSDRLGDFSKMIKDNVPARLEFNKFGENEAIFSFKEKMNVNIMELNSKKIDDYLDKFN